MKLSTVFVLFLLYTESSSRLVKETQVHDAGVTLLDLLKRVAAREMQQDGNTDMNNVEVLTDGDFSGIDWSDSEISSSADPISEHSQNGIREGADYPDGVPEGADNPDGVPEGADSQNGVPEGADYPDGVPEGADYPERVPEGAYYPDVVPEGAYYPDGVPEGADYPDGVPEGAYSQKDSAFSGKAEPNIDSWSGVYSEGYDGCSNMVNNVGSIDKTSSKQPGFVNSDLCGRRQVFRRKWNRLYKFWRKTKAEERIVNGKPAEVGEFPWVVFLVVTDHGSISTCGGSLISEDWVLTAAHCITSLGDVGQFVVRVGEHDLQSDVEKHQDIHVTKAIVHPHYDKDSNQNDIALLKLSEPANVAMPHINTICLSEDEFPIGTKCIVAGWGLTKNEASDISYILRRADLQIEPSTRCPYGGLAETQLCAGGYLHPNAASLADSCQGDSGGPLFCKRNGVYFQAGIVSFGDKCGDPDAVGVYTKVAKYINWINCVMKAN